MTDLADEDVAAMEDPSTGVAAPERVYRELRRAILEGEFPPGQRLGTQALAERWGVSRTPVRAALVRLEAEGLVEVTDGRSVRVRALTADEVAHAYDVAMGLEGSAVYRLASAATQEQLDALLTAVDGMEAAAASGDRADWVAHDERFHAMLAEFSDNPLLRLMMERVETVIGRLRFVSLHVNPSGAEESAHEHHSVVEAIRAHDGELARRLHQDHWDRVGQANVGFLREGFSGSSGYLLGTPRHRSRPGEGGAVR